MYYIDIKFMYKSFDFIKITSSNAIALSLIPKIPVTINLYKIITFLFDLIDETNVFCLILNNYRMLKNFLLIHIQQILTN